MQLFGLSLSMILYSIWLVLCIPYLVQLCYFFRKWFVCEVIDDQPASIYKGPVNTILRVPSSSICWCYAIKTLTNLTLTKQKLIY